MEVHYDQYIRKRMAGWYLTIFYILDIVESGYIGLNHPHHGPNISHLLEVEWEPIGNISANIGEMFTESPSSDDDSLSGIIIFSWCVVAVFGVFFALLIIAHWHWERRNGRGSENSHVAKTFIMKQSKRNDQLSTRFSNSENKVPFEKADIVVV